MAHDIWDDIENADVRGNRDRLGEGRGVGKVTKCEVKRSENPKEKGTMRLIIEMDILEHDEEDIVGRNKSFSLNMSSEFTQGEVKGFIAASLGEAPTAMTKDRMRKAVDGGEIVGRCVRLNRVLTESKGGNTYYRSFFDPYEGPSATRIPEGWFPHPDRAGLYYNAAGETKKLTDF